MVPTTFACLVSQEISSIHLCGSLIICHIHHSNAYIIIEGLGGYEQSRLRAGYFCHKWRRGLKVLTSLHWYTQTLVMCPLKSMIFFRHGYFPFMSQEILSDSSDGKQTSHGRLRNFIDKHGVQGLKNAYKWNPLIAICAYKVCFNCRATKDVLATLLMQAVQLHNCIPQPLLVDNQFSMQAIRTADDAEQRIVLRFRRTSTNASAQS